MKTDITLISQLGKAILGLGLILLLCVSVASAGDIIIIKEDFENASGWTTENSGTAWAIDDDKAHMGDKSANCADGEFSAGGTYLPNTASSIKKTYTKGFKADGSYVPIRQFMDLRLTFYYKCMGSPSWDYGQVKINDTLVAPLIDHDGDPNTAPRVMEDQGYACSGDCPDEWSQAEIFISAFDRTDSLTLEFYFQSNESREYDGFFVDDIEITGDWSLTVPDPPINPFPADETRNVPLETSLSWTNPGVLHKNTHQVQVLLDIVTDDPPDPPTTIVHAFAETSPDPLTEEGYSLSNGAIGGPLSGSSTYQWTVITKNTESDDTTQRTWSFKTACSVVTAFPWFEGFEGEWEEEPATAPATAPLCWTPITDPTATNYWEPNESTVHSGSYSAKGPWGSEGGVQWLLTPELNMSSGETSLKFWLKGSYAGGTNLYVMIGDDKSDLDAFTRLESYIAGLNMPNNWEAQVIDLTAYSGSGKGNKYIAFKMVDDDGFNVYIDDIQVYELQNKASTITEGGGTEPTTISSAADTEGDAVYVFDVTFNDVEPPAPDIPDGLPTIIDQIKFTQADNNAVYDWTDAIEGATLFGPDLGAAGLAGTVEADHILFTGVDFISIAHNASETYQLKIWLKTDLSAVEDHNLLGFKLDYTDVITDVSGSTFIEGAPHSGDGVAIDITATQLKFTTQPHDRAVKELLLPITLIVTAQDANGNTDLDYTGMVTLTNTTGLTMDKNAEAASSGVVTFAQFNFTQIGGSTNLVTTNTDNLANDTTTIGIMVTGRQPEEIWNDDFEGAVNWTFTGEFEIGPPLGKGGSFGNPDPDSAYDGVNVLGTDLSGLGDNPGDCEPDLTDREYTATSPSIDCSGRTKVALKFYHWLNTQDTDFAYIDVYDGTKWNEVWASSDIIEETAWNLQEIDISKYADNKLDVKIRFSYGSSNSDFPYSGWNIDAVEVVQRPDWEDMSYEPDLSEVFHKNTDYVVQGLTNQEIIGIKVITNNQGLPLVMDQLWFNTQGSTSDSDITVAKVYYTGLSDVFATGTLFGETNAIGTDGAFSITGGQELEAGVNYFWLAYDIEQDALLDHYVDAQCTKITISDADYDLNADPDGKRKIFGPPILQYAIGILKILADDIVLPSDLSTSSTDLPKLILLDYTYDGKIEMGDAIFVLEYLAGLREF
ncbi:BNR-repeat neuraminidase N-terminal domain-containing protein [Desulfococcaceae bacterium HSG9]|nr:BNR-repeat neuraminidase N-terminal domain-containing protein [Desulfococcaceae bacterium HSG9]